MCNAHCAEPSLDELFGDVAIQLLMQRDSVTESDVRELLDGLQHARAERCGEPTLQPGAVIGPCQPRDRENDNPSSRSAGSPDARPFPIRFI
jgi:hypothetical protein